MAKSEFLIGRKVMKRTGKPFKSTLKTNTIKSVITHEITGRPAFTFYEDDSYVELHKCSMVDVKINLKEVERLYPNFVLLGVKSFYIPGESWLTFRMVNQKPPEQVIMKCYMLGADKVQLRIKHELEIKYPDYSIKELIKNI